MLGVYLKAVNLHSLVHVCKHCWPLEEVTVSQQAVQKEPGHVPRQL